MAHEISVTVQGTTEAVFGFGEIPWWNSSTLSATVLDRAVSFDEIFTIAFPWTADMEQLIYADGMPSSQHGIRRSDTKAELGVHSGTYGNIQPRDLFDFCAAFFVESQVPIASAIAMRGGKVLNISARLGELNILNSGDIHKSYLCFVNSFDGSLKAEVYKSYVQPVCMNTTIVGLASADFKMEYKHSKHVQKRIHADINQVKQLMIAQQATDQKVQSVLESLAKVKPSREAYETILTELFGDGDTKKTSNKKAQFTAIVANGVNATVYPDFRGTGYGIYTALTDYVDHYQTVRMTDGRSNMDQSQIRFERSTIGDGAKLKAKGLEVLERVLVLADGSSCEDKPMYMDMVYGNSSESVWPSIKPMDPYPYNGDTSQVYSTIADFTKDTTPIPIWDSLPLPDDSPVDCLTMYTTLDQALFPAQCALESIVETLPSGVSMKAVRVPVSNTLAFIDLCKHHDCAVFTADQWTDLHK